jgi:hypothetical protein
MLSRLFGRQEPRPDFPERADLPHLTDKEAHAALRLLQLLVEGGVADVYTRPFMPEGQRSLWNVWFGEQIKSAGERIDLREWAERSLYIDYRLDGDAA